MHSTQLSREVEALHNGDYSGDVVLVVKGEAVEESEYISGIRLVRVKIPFQSLKRLVANYVVDQKISRLEQAKADDVLGTGEE